MSEPGCCVVAERNAERNAEIKALKELLADRTSDLSFEYGLRMGAKKKLDEAFLEIERLKDRLCLRENGEDIEDLTIGCGPLTKP